jgi:hypothetical protein
MHFWLGHHKQTHKQEILGNTKALADVLLRLISAANNGLSFRIKMIPRCFVSELSRLIAWLWEVRDCSPANLL